MSRRSLSHLSVPLIMVVLLPNAWTRAQESIESVINPAKSDREKAGLRGPVHSVTEERTLPPWNGSSGESIPEIRTKWKTEYDRDGRITETRGRGWSRDKGMDAKDSVTRYTYSPTGQLLRMARERNGEPDGELVYRYDGQGRLESIADSKDPGNPIAFRYDADGRKTKIAIAQPPKQPGPGAVSASTEYFFQTESAPIGLPEGGSTTTLYDQRDRPTEVQTRNANGEIMYRTVRVYDDQGNILEEKQTMEDPISIIPMAEQKKIIDQAGVSAQELRDQIAQVLGGSEMGSTKYSYDAEGRQTLKVFKALMGRMEQRIETAFNEHGDAAKETEHMTTSGMPEGADNGTKASERIYSYDYDSYGNWTVKKFSSRSLPDGTFKDSGDEVRRTIEYY